MILLTGGSGLLGRSVLEALLKEDKPVRALVNKTPLDIIHPRLEIFQGSLLDVITIQEALVGIDEIYHCAGMVSYTSGKAQQLYKVNVEGTANLVNAALLAGVRKMIHVSSVAALNSGNSSVPVADRQPWDEVHPDTPYGKSKYLAEMEVWRGMAEGLNMVIVNPSIILGAGNWNEGSTALFKKVHDGFNWFTSGGTGYVGVDDVARAMIWLMKSDIQNERFIISAENITYRDVLTKMAHAFGKTPPKRQLSQWLGGLLWRMEYLRSKLTGKEQLITKQTVQKAFETVKYDNRKFLLACPQFRYTPIEEVIKETAQVLQQKVNNR